MANRHSGKMEISLRQRVFLFLLSCLAWTIVFTPGLLSARTFDFNSGSTGANGGFPPAEVPNDTTDIILNLNNGEVTFLPGGTVTTLPSTPAEGFRDGIFNFTMVNLPSDVTLSFIPHTNNPPITFLATGDITIDGTIDVSGKEGEDFETSGHIFSMGGQGGPGGFNGGNGGAAGATNNIGSGGLGPGGGLPGKSGSRTRGGSYGAAGSFAALIPLFGGSGGGGGFGNSLRNGAGGGGGGGAILLASSTNITINGAINANGGSGGSADSNGNGSCNTNEIGVGGGGSGGAIRMVAETIGGTGLLGANGGSVFSTSCATTGGRGRIRLEAFTQSFSGSFGPAPSVIFSPGPVAPTSNPALSLLPGLAITSVGGINASVTTTGDLSTPDISLPQGTTNPVTVVLTTNNIPVDTIFTVRVSPQFGNPVNVSSTASVDTGNPGEATATAQVNLPAGVVATLSAFADFTIQTASLFPLIDGERIDRVTVATNFGEKPYLSFFTQSGRRISERKMMQWMGLTQR